MESSSPSSPSSSYPYAPDDYALNLLTQAAIHDQPGAHARRPHHHQRPGPASASAPQQSAPSSSTAITNHHEQLYLDLDLALVQPDLHQQHHLLQHYPPPHHHHHQQEQRAAAAAAAASNTAHSRMAVPPYGPYDPSALSTRSMETLVYTNPAAHSHPHPQSHPHSQSHSLGLAAGRQNGYAMNHGFPGAAAPQTSTTAADYAGSLGILDAESYDDGREALRAQEASEMRMQRQVRTMPFGLTREQQVQEQQQQAQRDQREREREMEQAAVAVAAAKDMNVEGEDAAGASRRRKKPRIEVNSADDDEDAGKKARGRPRVDTKDETAADRRRTQIRMAQRAYRHRKETTISSLEKQVQELQGNNEEMSSIFITLYDYAVGQGLLEREPQFGQQLESTTRRFLALAKANTTEDLAHEEPHIEESDKQSIAEPDTGRRQKGRKASSKKPKQATPPQLTPPAPPQVQPWGGYSVSKAESPVEELPIEYPEEYESRGRSENLQVITRPTEDNASFPFEFMDMQQYRAEIPELEPAMQDFSQYFLPRSQPPLPTTLTFNEFSFARRIHRMTTERGLKLLTMKNPPQSRVQRIFGICLTYSTKEQIVQRLKATLAATNKDSLHQWREPFVNIGGAGTFYPMYDFDIDGTMMPKFRTGLSMGPFSPPASAARGAMQEDMRCALPGFEGDFFDVNDVEGYLRGQGIEIPSGADYVTAELDLGSLTEGASPRSTTTMAPTLSPRTPRSPIEGLLINRPKDLGYSSGPQQLNVPAKTLSFDYNNWNLNPPEHDATNIDLIFNTLIQQDGQKQATERALIDLNPSKRRVTLNVETLVRELIDRVTCLGRSPGFRPSDINIAIVAAVEAGFSP